MFEMIDSLYRKIIRRETGALFHRRADYVGILCIVTSAMLAVYHIYEYLFVTTTNADIWIILFLIPYTFFLHKYIGWWAGWIFIAQVIILAVVYVPVAISNEYIRLLSAYLLSSILAGYVYGIRGIFIASSVQTLGFWYWHVFLAGKHMELWQIIPAFLSAMIWVVMFGYSEYIRSSLIHDVHEKSSMINDAYHATIIGLADALELRDNETYEHSERVSRLTVDVAARFGFTGEALENVQRGAILHDLGKLGIPDAILRKPGPLTSEEWDVMKQHPDLAVHIVQNVSFLIPALPILQSHHERWDGSGYPSGLVGEEIPLEARIFAVVDVYDALTSNRPYHDAMSHTDALAFLYEKAGTLFDPTVIPVFEEVLLMYISEKDVNDEDYTQ
jgi:HD-GYP domain-containing protein (c-di-GMP phosphodiesterase class II)